MEEGIEREGEEDEVDGDKGSREDAAERGATEDLREKQGAGNGGDGEGDEDYPSGADEEGNPAESIESCGKRSPPNGVDGKEVRLEEEGDKREENDDGGVGGDPEGKGTPGRGRGGETGEECGKGATPLDFSRAVEDEGVCEGTGDDRDP